MANIMESVAVEPLHLFVFFFSRRALTTPIHSSVYTLARKAPRPSTLYVFVYRSSRARPTAAFAIHVDMHV